MGVLGERAGLPLWLFAMPLCFYLFDTTYTLARRACRGENVFQAHRQHLYQRLTRLGWSHLQVDLGVLLLTLTGGGAGYAWRLGDRWFAGSLFWLTALLLLGAAWWIERRDRCAG